MDIITSTFNQIITWIGTFIQALFSEPPATDPGTVGALHALLPFFVISIGVSICLVAIKMIRKLVYGA